MRHEDDMVGAMAIFFRFKIAAKFRRNSEQRKSRRRDTSGVDTLRFTSPGEVEVNRFECGSLGENAVLRTVVEILLSRDTDIVAALQGEALRYEDQAAGIPVWQRMKQN